MTAVATLTGAFSDRLTARRLQARMVKVVSRHYLMWQHRVPRGALARSERHAGKRARAVLGGWAGAIPPGYPALGKRALG